MITISPGTICSELISSISPSRLTRDFGAVIFCSASIAFSALYSCTTPITAFKIITNRIITASTCSPIAIVMTTAPKRTYISISLSCEKNREIKLFLGFPLSLFSPYFSSLAFASLLESPAVGSTLSSFKASC
ncbi:hypothetical protein SDC9_150370 [bioreactor metagenome]|uniref:Uncharacterized protein n=1 Tax=bioreactor metagenome TaxID=1076179 RepID=A0A645EMW0_9ZZZZ